MAYSQNQFYKLKDYEADVGLQSADFRNETDNPRFLWPSRTNVNTVTGEDKTVNRGYMRLISTAFGADYTNLGKRRLHFQFNPETLSRNVTARNDVQLWMNQDPIQFTQPIPGDANFNFELIFNREAEVASGRYQTNNGVSDGNKKYSALNSDGTVNPTYDPSSVTQIGVLADLLVFDQLIGQGINKTLIDALAAKAEKDIDAYNAQKKAEAKASGVDITDAAAVIPGLVDTSASNIDKTLNLGIGNSAFIVSQPIRIVFSSLYMVEGFITSTNVTFDKFNPAMVPVQCRIAVSMQAMYIGFAAKKTFLSQIYDDVAETDYDNNNGTDTPEGKAELPELNKLGLNLWRAIESGGGTDPSGMTDYSANPFKKVMRSTVSKGDALLFKVALKPTLDFREWVRKFSDNGKVTATCEWLIKYYGRSNTVTNNTIVDYKPAGTGYDGAKKPIVFARRAQYNVDLTDVEDDRDSMEFEFERPQYAVTDAGNPAKPNYGDWDTHELAVWESIITITFTIDGSSAVGIEAAQMITGKYTDNWNENGGESGYSFHAHNLLKLLPTGGVGYKFDPSSEEAG